MTSRGVSEIEGKCCNFDGVSEIMPVANRETMRSSREGRLEAPGTSAPLADVPPA